MDGIHIVAFAEEADPGEGGMQVWVGGAGDGETGVLVRVQASVGGVPRSAVTQG